MERASIIEEDSVDFLNFIGASIIHVEGVSNMEWASILAFTVCQTI